jgi:hypothetical protein
MANEKVDASKSADAPNEFYRAYCIDEDTWIGGSSGDQVVAQNRANHHAAETGHSTEVRPS